MHILRPCGARKRIAVDKSASVSRSAKLKPCCWHAATCHGTQCSWHTYLWLTLLAVNHLQWCWACRHKRHRHKRQVAGFAWIFCRNPPGNYEHVLFGLAHEGIAHLHRASLPNWLKLAVANKGLVRPGCPAWHAATLATTQGSCYCHGNRSMFSCACFCFVISLTWFLRAGLAAGPAAPSLVATAQHVGRVGQAVPFGSQLSTVGRKVHAAFCSKHIKVHYTLCMQRGW